MGDWHRRIEVGNPNLEVAGLVELMDNNPMVCADEMSVPDCASTLALIALGLLARSGMIIDKPTIQLNIEADPVLVDAFLHREGWSGGTILATEPREDKGIAAIALAPITTPEALEDIDDLYNEAFGRSFFVKRCEDGAWSPELVLGQPHAAYRLRITAGAEESLLTVQVLGDRDGKCGAAQVVHAMNVMAGFEETVGLA